MNSKNTQLKVNNSTLRNYFSDSKFCFLILKEEFTEETFRFVIDLNSFQVAHSNALELVVYFVP